MFEPLPPLLGLPLLGLALLVSALPGEVLLSTAEMFVEPHLAQCLRQGSVSALCRGLPV